VDISINNLLSKGFYSLHEGSKKDNISSSYLWKGQNGIAEVLAAVLYIFNIYLEK